jgi:hypothetical protein
MIDPEAPDFERLAAVANAKTIADLHAVAAANNVRIPSYIKSKEDTRRHLALAVQYPAGMDFAEYEGRFSAPEAPSSPGLDSLRTLDTDRANLERVVAQEPVRVQPLGGGNTSDNALVTYPDGTQTVRKTYAGAAGRLRGKEGTQEDAETLAPLVLSAAGIRAPAVVRTGPNTIEMTHISGQSGYSVVGSDSLKVPAEVLNSDDGRLLGLADALMGYTDRDNPGNWLVQPDGHLAGIDHGLAFQDGAATGNPFAAHFVGGNGTYRTNDMSPADMVQIRTRLESSRPQFEAAGRGEWFDQMMTRFDAIEAKAHGRRNRIAPADAPVTQSKSVNVADLRTLDTEHRRDALDLRKVDELKAMLREQGLPVSGRKRDLVDRLVGHLEGEGAGPAAPAPAATVGRPPKSVGRNIAGKVDYESLPPEYNRATRHDDALEEIVKRQGFDGKPQVVLKAEFDAAVKRGEVRETWRGVGRHDTELTPDQLAEAYRTGDFYVGLGINGNGTYVAMRRADGEYYSGFSGGHPTLLRIGLRKDARVISADDLDREMDAYFAANHTTAKHQSLQREMLAALAKAKTPRARANIRRDYYRQEFYGPDRRSRLLAIQRDPGRFAALRGYDAIDIPKERSPDKHAEMIILNRTATIVQAAE